MSNDLIAYVCVASSPGSHGCVGRKAGRQRREPGQPCMSNFIEFVCLDTTFLRSTIDIQEVFLDDVLSYSQKVLGIQSATFKEQQVVAIKCVCSSNDTFVCFPTGYMKCIYYQVIQLCEVCK